MFSLIFCFLVNLIESIWFFNYYHLGTKSCVCSSLLRSYKKCLKIFLSTEYLYVTSFVRIFFIRH